VDAIAGLVGDGHNVVPAGTVLLPDDRAIGRDAGGQDDQQDDQQQDDVRDAAGNGGLCVRS